MTFYRLNVIICINKKMRYYTPNKSQLSHFINMITYFL
nr:MAG TPA: hypothetical protein [Caudoviricetes sp.]